MLITCCLFGGIPCVVSTYVQSSFMLGSSRLTSLSYDSRCILGYNTSGVCLIEGKDSRKIPAVNRLFTSIRSEIPTQIKERPLVIT